MQHTGKPVNLPDNWRTYAVSASGVASAASFTGLGIISIQLSRTRTQYNKLLNALFIASQEERIEITQKLATLEKRIEHLERVRHGIIAALVLSVIGLASAGTAYYLHQPKTDTPEPAPPAPEPAAPVAPEPAAPAPAPAPQPASTTPASSAPPATAPQATGPDATFTTPAQARPTNPDRPLTFNDFEQVLKEIGTMLPFTKGQRQQKEIILQAARQLNGSVTKNAIYKSESSRIEWFEANFESATDAKKQAAYNLLEQAKNATKPKKN